MINMIKCNRYMHDPDCKRFESKIQVFFPSSRKAWNLGLEWFACPLLAFAFTDEDG